MKFYITYKQLTYTSLIENFGLSRHTQKGISNKKSLRFRKMLKLLKKLNLVKSLLQTSIMKKRLVTQQTQKVTD